MGVPSAAIVYTGESGNMQGSGRGAAYSEGISSTLDIIDSGLKDIRENEKLKKEEAMKKAQAWNSLMEETPDVWNVDYEKVNQKALEYTKYVTDLKARGYDPFNLPPEQMRELTRLRNDVTKEANAAKANKDWFDKNTFNINDDAGKTWDQGHAADWFKKFTDPNLTPSERAKLRQEGNPYLKNVDLVDIVSSIGEQMDNQKITKGGYDITQKSPEDFKKLISIYFADQGGMDDYEALMNRGKYKNDEELLNDATTIFKSLYQPSSVRRGGSGGGGGTKSGGTTTEKKQETFIAAEDKIPDSKWSQDYNVNVVSIGGKKPPVYVYDDNGNPIMNFVPDDGFYLKPGNAVEVIGTGTIEEVQPDGTKLTKQIKTQVDYQKNMRQFNAAGYPDVFQYYRDRTGQGGGTSTPTVGGKTLAERMRGN